MIKLDIQPLSVNKSYRWKKVKTQDLIDFHSNIDNIIRYWIWIDYFNYIDFNKKWLQLKLDVRFWFSNIWSDIDNWLKTFIDWLFWTIWQNDNLIYELNVKKQKTKKNEEFIEFELSEI